MPGSNQRHEKPGSCIFLTGHGSEEDFEAGASEAGDEYYLIKPVNIQELTAKIHASFGAGAV